MTELPPLPEPLALVAQYSGEWKETVSIHAQPVFTADQMRAYAQEAARQEREAIAVDWEREHGFDKYGVAEEIRSRSTSPSTQENGNV